MRTKKLLILEFNIIYLDKITCQKQSQFPQIYVPCHIVPNLTINVRKLTRCELILKPLFLLLLNQYELP